MFKRECDNLLRPYTDPPPKPAAGQRRSSAATRSQSNNGQIYSVLAPELTVAKSQLVSNNKLTTT